ncbi:hypothetical protein [Listeria grandensis]|uniref:hypothetical protein n=1 Tax=Listeria grandensis TaxID=1494963 RepID=UPI00164E3508|nr:hypothetical protein [Listeria grandensis]MBC6316247.1 hypothetical protein [Listeria grandensis]
MEKLVQFLTEDHYLKSMYTKMEHWKQGEVVYCNAKDKEVIGCIMKGQAIMRFCHENGDHRLAFLDQYDLVGVENLIEWPDPIKANVYEIIALTDIMLFTARKDYYLDHMYANPKYFHCVLSQLARKSIVVQSE